MGGLVGSTAKYISHFLLIPEICINLALAVLIVELWYFSKLVCIFDSFVRPASKLLL